MEWGGFGGMVVWWSCGVAVWRRVVWYGAYVAASGSVAGGVLGVGR